MSNPTGRNDLWLKTDIKFVQQMGSANTAEGGSAFIQHSCSLRYALDVANFCRIAIMDNMDTLIATSSVKTVRNFCRPYTYESRDYTEAFRCFLARTNQKHKAKEAILQCFQGKDIEKLVDVGAGDGTLTKMVSGDCNEIVLIEPNCFFVDEAKLKLPGAKIVDKKIQDVQFRWEADAVLVAHVFFHINPREWLEVLRTCCNFLKPGGIVVLLLQNKDSDYMKIFDALKIDHKNLDFIIDEGMPSKIGMEVLDFRPIPSYVECMDEGELIEIGEFQLNSLRAWEPIPAKKLLELTNSVTGQSAAFPRKISCTQDILVLSKPDSRP